MKPYPNSHKFQYEFLLTDFVTVTKTTINETVELAELFTFWLIHRFGLPGHLWFHESKLGYVYFFKRQEDAALVTLLWSNGSVPDEARELMRKC